jgi:hypothetical protein
MRTHKGKFGWISIAWAAIFLGALAPSFAAIDPGTAKSLADSERASLRYRLENLFNEVDLLVKNQRADISDLRRQEKEIDYLKIYQRIPFQKDLPGLKENLKKSAKNFQLQLIAFSPASPVRQGLQKSSPLPRQIFTDQPTFQLTPDHIVDVIPFSVTIAGNEESVQKWIKSWRTEQMRLVDLRSLKNLQKGKWRIEAQSYRFRNVQFPVLRPRNPREILPAWAKKNPENFSVAEPLLWSFVTRIEALVPKAKPYYEVRRQFLLNDARIHFFLSKATPQ